MADGTFPGLVSKDTALNAATNPIYTQLTNGTAVIGVTGGALDVNVASGSVTVTATDLDIRDLVQGSGNDNVTVWANTAKDGSGTDYVPLVDADGKIIISNPSSATEYTEDVAAAQPASGPAMLAERDDALGGITPAAGDWSKLYVNANGALWVKHDGDVTISDGGNTITVDGTVAATQSGAWTVAATQSGVWDIGTVTTLTGITNDVSIDDGGNSITVDATQLDVDDLNLTDDAVRISGNATANGLLNPIFVQTVNTAVLGDEVHDYDTAAAVASAASDNHDYTVTGTTFLLKSVIFSGSGNVKAEIQTGPVAGLATVAVAFLTGRQGDTKQLNFDPPIEVPVTSTGTVRVIRTNRQGSATDVYSTIIGLDVV